MPTKLALKNTIQSYCTKSLILFKLQATQAQKFGDISQKSINSVYEELVLKLSNTQVNEFIDSFKQSTAAHKGMGTLAGQNLNGQPVKSSCES